ncbi:MAG: hypothetical protein HY820_30890 [Acidobacteria bacterium]|nr:hypothetical protein [Acidobacteriota bacterium]
MQPRTVVLCGLLATAIVPFASAQTALPASACDSACLNNVMSSFLKAMTTGASKSVSVADNAEIRDNAKLVPLDQTAWRSVKAIKSVMTFSDPATGNVVSRAGVELASGKPGYISTRLKVVGGGRISDVELSSDTSARVVAEYVWNLDPLFGSVLPADQRLSRVDLEALARRYFHSLSTHVAITADFDDRCDRYHSGQRITNVAINTVEGGPPRTCAGSLGGNPPWGPATEQRFPVVDAERGIVVGITLLHYPELPNQAKMYVSEVFKVVSGRIVRIDNIGLMLPGVTTLGFVH